MQHGVAPRLLVASLRAGVVGPCTVLYYTVLYRGRYAPRSSQHMFDPYSFCLVVVGLLLHLLWGTDHIDTWGYGFLAAVIAELGHKVVINSQFVLRQIRNNSGTSGEYIGKETE